VPETVNVALAELAGEMREGLALAVGDRTPGHGRDHGGGRDRTCGLKGRHDPERTATRHGHAPDR